MAGDSDTAWIKSPIEGLETEDDTEEQKTAKQYDVADYDKLVDIPKSADEAILLGTGTGTGTGSATGSATGSGSGSKKYKTTMNFALLANKWRTGVESGPDVISAAMNSAAVAIVAACYLGDTTSAEAQKATQVIRRQLFRMITLFLSFLVIWNWWYLWNYTSFNFNFENLLDYPPFSILFYIFEPSFKVIELLNYYMITRRIDAGISNKGREFLRTLWDYRPITFGFFTMFILGGCMSLPFGRIFVDLFSGNPNGIAKIVIFMSIIMYIYVTVNPMRIRSFMVYFFWFPPIIIFVVLLLLLLVYLFSRFTAGMFAVYLLVLSHFTLLIFTRFNPFGAIWQIYHDLSTAPVSDAKTEDAVKQLGHFVFRKAHWLMMYSTIIALFSLNMSEVKGLTNPWAILFIIFVLNGWFFAISLPLLKIVFNVLLKIVDALTYNSWTGESKSKGVELPKFTGLDAASNIAGLGLSAAEAALSAFT